MKGFSVRRILKMPVPLVASKALRKGLAPLQRRRDCREAERILSLFREGRAPRIAGVPDDFSRTELPCSFDPAAVRALPGERRRMIGYFAGEACAHRFDLLGSGPVQVSYHTAASGFAGCCVVMPPGAGEERKVLEMMERTLGLAGGRAGLEADKGLLLESLQGYRPIDWHLDFRSGYRWEPASWYRDIPIGRTEGADIKVPWELSRFQHLAAMGLAYHLAEGPQARLPAAEFVLQLTDWIVSNPPRCGANWSCSMEVAIRAVNWLWGLKLFAGSPFLTPEFQRLINWSLYQHALFLRQNPENRDLFVGNHYLAGLAGQIHLEAACPWLPQNERRLRLAAGEFMVQAERQFNTDGSNFEGSTGYHRLTTEILYATALLLLHLGRERRGRLGRGKGGVDFARTLIFSHDFWSRAIGAAEYMAALLKPDGSSPQLGDFDNGRFHKLILTAVRDEKSGGYREEHRDFRPSLALAGVLFDRGDLKVAAEMYGAEARLGIAALETEILKELSRVGTEPMEARKAERVKLQPGAPDPFLPATGPAVQTIFYVDEGCGAAGQTGSGLPGGLQQVSPAYFPDAGTAVFDAPPFHLVISCSSSEAAGRGVHSHNDILSFELNVQGADLVVDPGSYVYTASIEERNYFRATAAHNTLLLPGREQRRWAPGLEGLFSLADSADAEVLGAGPGRFCGAHRGYGFLHRRGFCLLDGAVVIEDWIEGRKHFVLSFNLAQGTAVQELECGRYVLVRGKTRVYLEVKSEAALFRGRVERGFYSPSYGVKLPASRLLIECIFRGVD